MMNTRLGAHLSMWLCLAMPSLLIMTATTPEVGFKPKPQLALDMLRHAVDADLLNSSSPPLLSNGTKPSSSTYVELHTAGIKVVVV